MHRSNSGSCEASIGGTLIPNEQARFILGTHLHILSFGRTATWRGPSYLDGGSQGSRRIQRCLRVETDLDLRLRKAGFKVKLDKGAIALHRRRMTLAKSIAYQIQAGRARKELGISPVRTLLHSIIRTRPFRFSRISHHVTKPVNAAPKASGLEAHKSAFAHHEFSSCRPMSGI